MIKSHLLYRGKVILGHLPIVDLAVEFWQPLALRIVIKLVLNYGRQESIEVLLKEVLIIILFFNNSAQVRILLIVEISY